MRLAASRTFWTAGRSRPMSTPMMAITTSSSISVKPRRRDGRRTINDPQKSENGNKTEGIRAGPAPPQASLQQNGFNLGGAAVDLSLDLRALRVGIGPVELVLGVRHVHTDGAA